MSNDETMADDEAVWLECLRENFGSLTPVPAIIARFAATTRRDMEDVEHMLSATAVADWLHRLGGGVRVFGATRFSHTIDGLECRLRNANDIDALAALPALIAELEIFLTQLHALASNMPRDEKMLKNDRCF
jgi:two-component system sensor histidine kinase EvgS